MATSGEKLENAKAEQPLLEAHPEGPREAFSLYLYPSEDTVQGLIVHPLTHERARFKGLDGPGIATFLSNHLPRRKPKAGDSLSVDGSGGGPASRSEMARSAEAARKVDRFAVVRAGGRHLSRLPQGQPFEVRLEVDTADLIPETADRLEYKVSVFARRLEDGVRRTAGVTLGDLDAARTMTATVLSEPLPRGTYWLDTTATLSPMPVDPSEVPRTVVKRTLVRVH